MCSTPVPIGASLVEHIRESSSRPSSSEGRQQDCRPSALGTAFQTTHASFGSFHMALFGPSGSGRTSLAMDLAYSMALSSAISPCRGCRQEPCCCTSVTFLVCKWGTTNFPLVCRRKESLQQDLSDEELFRSRFEQVTRRQEEINRGGMDQSSLWKREVLKRIKMVYMTSAEDAVEYLLSIQGLPVHAQPSDGIIIDNADLLAKAPVFSGEDIESAARPTITQNQTYSTEALMKVVKLMAVFADTSHHLKLARNQNISILATFDSKMPSAIQNMVCTWLPTIVKIRFPSLPARHANTSEDDNWVIELEKSGRCVEAVSYTIHSDKALNHKEIVWA